ncbi:MAG TPA: CBS domain-containing protein [Caulobacteraceae bacterium]|nr:CBS domain-containing protein [Caulobacteraceae bacterium]
MKISDIMSRDVQVARPEDTLRDAAETMARIDVGSLPVCDGRRLQGIVTDRDIVVRGLAKGLGPDSGVTQVMTEGVEYCFDDDDLVEVSDKMAASQIRRIPVVDRDKNLVGIVSLGDVAREARPAEAGDVLEEVSQPGGNNLQ